MEVTSPLDPNALPLAAGVHVLKRHPGGLVAFFKPEGVKAHSNDGHPDPKALLNAHYDFAEQFFWWETPAGEERKFWLVNRLDSPTSGVILGASDEKIAADVRFLFAQREVSKVYYALVHGEAADVQAEWEDRLHRGHELRALHGIKAPDLGPEEARTRVRREGVGRGKVRCALLRLEPLTGRFHQLRLQASRRGYPIVGDATHGDFNRNREVSKLTGHKRLFLHAAEIRLHVPWKGRTEAFHATSPIPREFAQVLGLRD